MLLFCCARKTTTINLYTFDHNSNFVFQKSYRRILKTPKNKINKCEIKIDRICWHRNTKLMKWNRYMCCVTFRVAHLQNLWFRIFQFKCKFTRTYTQTNFWLDQLIGIVFHAFQLDNLSGRCCFFLYFRFVACSSVRVCALSYISNQIIIGLIGNKIHLCMSYLRFRFHQIVNPTRQAHTTKSQVCSLFSGSFFLLVFNFNVNKNRIYMQN